MYHYVMDILTKLLDQGVPVDVIYMELQKAFDSVLIYVNDMPESILSHIFFYLQMIQS